MSDFVQLIHKEKHATIDLEFGEAHFLMDDCIYRTIKIGKRECLLLQLLVERRGLLVSKNDMLLNVWKNSVVGENTVVVALSNIRKLIRRVDNECHCLVTISGRGYIFYPERSGLSIQTKNIGDNLFF